MNAANRYYYQFRDSFDKPQFGVVVGCIESAIDEYPVGGVGERTGLKRMNKNSPVTGHESSAYLDVHCVDTDRSQHEQNREPPSLEIAESLTNAVCTT
jgi:hypothetical protein